MDTLHSLRARNVSSERVGPQFVVTNNATKNTHDTYSVSEITFCLHPMHNIVIHPMARRAQFMMGFYINMSAAASVCGKHMITPTEILTEAHLMASDL